MVFRNGIIKSWFNCRVNGIFQKGIINSRFSRGVDGLSRYGIISEWFNGQVDGVFRKMSTILALKIILVLYPIVFVCLELCSFPSSKKKKKKIKLWGS